MLWGITTLGTAVGLMWVGLDRTGVANDILRLAGCSFAGLCFGALAVRRADWSWSAAA